MSVKGLSLRRIPADKPGASIPVFRLHYSADPTMTGDKLLKLRSTYTSDARWLREMEVAYEALEGELLYPEFNRELNVCEPFDVTDTDIWTIYMGADPHGRTPHAFTWQAFHKNGVDRVVCGELWPGTHFPGQQFTVAQYACAIEAIESDSTEKPSWFDWARGKKLKVYYRVMDTHGHAVNSDEGKDYFETYRKHDLHFWPALKGETRLAVARDSIGTALLPITYTNSNGESFRQSALRVFDGCVETISEFERVRYPEGDPERPADERPMTYRKHCLDCLAYIETANPGFALQRPVKSDWEPIYESIGY